MTQINYILLYLKCVCILVVFLRFSSDVDIVDNRLAESFRLWIIMTFSAASVIIVVGVITPMFMAAIIPVAIVYTIVVVSCLINTTNDKGIKESPCLSVGPSVHISRKCNS